MNAAAWDTEPTDYQAGLLLAALADSQHRIPSDARVRTLDIMRSTKRQWIRPRRRSDSLAAVEAGVKDFVLTHHGVNAANKVKAAQSNNVEKRPRTVDVEGIGWTCVDPGRTWAAEHEGVKFELERRTRNVRDECPDTGWYLYGGSHFGEYMAARFKEAAVEAFPHVCPKDGHPQPANEEQEPAERFPVDSAAVYVPEPTESYRDVVIVKSRPDADGKVDAISGRYNGKNIRVPLDKLQQLPALTPAPEGKLTDWWGIFDREGNEVTQVEATGYEHARQEAEKDPKARAESLRAGGLVYRRLRTSEVTTQQPPKVTTAAQARRTITVTTGYTRKSIPTRLRESGAPGRMQYSEAAGALRWVLPNGKELTPGEAEKAFLN